MDLADFIWHLTYFPPDGLKMTMIGITQHIKSTFTSQSQKDNCGAACMLSIFNYCGINAQGTVLEHLSALGVKASLLDLRNAARHCGLNCKCVALDKQTLKSLKGPLILHTFNEEASGHFVIYYGYEHISDGGLFLIGDPAKALFYAEEDFLDEIWPGKAALYFENLLPATRPVNLRFLPASLLPWPVWLAVALLSVSVVVTGGCFSLLLQQVLSGHTFSGTRLHVEVFVLLSALLCFKCLLTYIKQRIAIESNMIVNQGLLHQIWNISTNNVTAGTPVRRAFDSGKTLMDIQKLQTAILVLVAIFSDLFLLLCMISILFFILPELGFFSLGILVIYSGSLLLWLPKMNFYHSWLENRLLLVQATSKNETIDLLPKWKQAYENYMFAASLLAKRSCRINFSYEILGTIQLLVAVAYNARFLETSRLSASMYVIIVLIFYYLGALTQKICMQMIQVVDGAAVYQRSQNKI